MTWNMRLFQGDTVQLKVITGTLYAYCANRIEFTGNMIEELPTLRSSIGQNNQFQVNSLKV